MNESSTRPAYSRGPLLPCFTSTMTITHTHTHTHTQKSHTCTHEYANTPPLPGTTTTEQNTHASMRCPPPPPPLPPPPPPTWPTIDSVTVWQGVLRVAGGERVEVGAKRSHCCSVRSSTQDRASWPPRKRCKGDRLGTQGAVTRTVLAAYLKKTVGTRALGPVRLKYAGCHTI